MKPMLGRNIRLALEKDDTYSLRGICMLLIIVHHLFQYSVSKYGVEYNNVVALILQNIGYLSTSVFFLLSGYGLSGSIHRNKPVNCRYIYTNIKKLISPFVFISIIDIIFCIIESEIEVNKVLINFFTLSLSSGGGFWFMKVIFVLYTSTLAAYKLIPNDRFVASIILLLVVIYIICAISFHIGSQWYNSILCFPIGILVSTYKENNFLLSFSIIKWGGDF